MYFSKYVIFHNDKAGRPYLYNTLTNAIIKVSSSDINETNYMNCHRYSLDEKYKLQQYGFLYEDVEDELRLYQHLKNMYKEKRSIGRQHVYIGVTYDCNMNCTYCFEKRISRTKEHITKENVDTIFSEISKDSAEITLYGGEPLLKNNKDIIEYIFLKAIEDNIMVSIITNGINLLLYKNMLKSYSNCIDSVIITLDGIKEYHDKTRVFKNGMGTFDIIMNNIDEIFKEEINFEIIIRINISDGNSLGIDFLVNELSKKNYFDKLKFRIFKVEDYSNIGLKLQNKNSWFDIIRNLEKRYGSKIEIRVPAYQKLKKVFGNNTEFTLPLFEYCEKEHLHVYGNDGNKYFCPESIGDLSVSDARELIKLKAEKECAKCCYFPLCGGGCDYNRMVKESSSYYCDEVRTLEKSFWDEYIASK